MGSDPRGKSDEGANRSARTRALTWGAVGVVAVAVAGAGVVVALRQREPAPVPTKTAPIEPDDGRVDVGRYFDWQLGTGSLAKDVRELVSLPLAETLASGDALPKLVKTVTWDAETATVTLAIKENIVWSDNARFEGRQIADAWARAKRVAGKSPDVELTDEEKAWMQSVSIGQPDRFTLKAGPFTSEKAMHAWLGSRLVRPVRVDLLGGTKEGEAENDAAWSVGLGPYLFGGELARRVPKDAGKLDLLPNKLFYQRATEAGKTVELGPYLKS